MSVIIRAQGLGKAYKQYSHKWSRLAEWMNPFGKTSHHLHWVLQNISFELSAGQALGVIGVNGAGKSTLLKMLAGTISPSSGAIVTSGRLAALLELGMGFHPEFTGRQNVLMSGQLLGYAKEQIIALMPQIEEFAGIGDYIDQPVRVYSSGMQVRLAFSIATAIRPDILIIDEALSVGDVEFQHRSYDRIRQFQKQGTALLFVSHDKSIITSLCDRAILLNQGNIAVEGDPEMVMDYYNALLAEQAEGGIKQSIGEDGKIQTSSGSGEVSLQKLTLVDQSDQALEVVSVGQKVILKIDIACKQPISSLVAGYMIKDRLGQVIFGTNSFYCGQQFFQLTAGETVQYQFEFLANLGLGTYSIAIALHADENHISKNYLWLDRALFFTVINSDQIGFVGSNWMPPILRCIRNHQE